MPVHHPDCQSVGYTGKPIPSDKGGGNKKTPQLRKIRVWPHLVAEYDGDVGDGERVAGGRLVGAAERDERFAAVAVVHVG